MIYNFLYSNSREELERYIGDVIEFNVPAKDIDEATDLAVRKALKEHYQYVLIFVWTPEPVAVKVVDAYFEVFRAFFEKMVRGGEDGEKAVV